MGGGLARGLAIWWALLVPAAVWPASSHAADDAACTAAAAAYDTTFADYAARIARSPPQPLELREEGDGPKPTAIRDAARARLEAAETASGARSLDAAFALLDLAVAERNLSRFEAALALLERGVAIAGDQAPASELAGDLLRERGIVNSRKRLRQAALADFDRAIAIYEQAGAGASEKAALTARTKADILRGLNRFNDALLALDGARLAYEAKQPARAADLAEVLTDLSIIHARLDDRQTALALAERAAAIAAQRLGPANRPLARALHNVGISQRRLDRHTEALAAFAKAQAIYVTPCPASIIRAAEALEDAAVTFSRLTCYGPAIDRQDAAIAAYREFYGGPHERIAAAEQRLGTLLRAAERRDDALSAFSRAASMFDLLLGPENPRSGKVYTDLANLHSAMGHADQATAYGLAMVRILTTGGGPDEARDGLWAMARILAAQGNGPGAILFAKKAVNRQQEIRAANRELPAELSKRLAERYRELYMYLADLLIADGRLEEAQFALDLIKQQEILDFVRGGRPELTSVDSRAVLTRSEQATSESIDKVLYRPIAAARALQELLKQGEDRLDDAEKARVASLRAAAREHFKAYQKEVKSLIDGLKTESAEAQRDVVQLHLKMQGQTRKKLRQFGGRAVLLQIASLDREVHVFLTTQTAQLHHSEPVPRAQMAKLAFAAWQAAARQKSDADAAMKALYGVLIGPIADELAASGADIVMLNLEGFLRYVPFAALNAGDRYLIEDYALALQTPVAETVYAAGERDRARAAGFGVTEALGDFAGLPGVARELETIFKGDDSTGVFDGAPDMNAAFTADSFAAALEERPLFVHIASHFKLTPGDEAGSFLLLGNGERLDLETIRTDERFQFTDVDLLALSACQTAGEVGNDGTEVESFATLAQGSGASSVLATLWPITDESTARLMSDFYMGLLDDGLDKATALRRAQVAMIRGEAASKVALGVQRGVNPAAENGGAAQPPSPVPFSHPHHWSAFILMGNWL